MIKILGYEKPEAVKVRGAKVPEELRDVILDWNDETRAVVEAQSFETCTIWTATRVLFGRYQTWVSVNRNPSV